MEVIYEDNHIIIVNKSPGEIVQGDKTGDTPLVEIVRQYIKETYAKPGNVFCGVAHRIDRPVGGLVVFAKTSKALTRLNDMFRNNEIHKTYWAIVQGRPKQPEAHLTHYITSVERNNKSYASLRPKEGAARSELIYRTLAEGENYSLLEINLITGRKHQIRVQLSTTGTPIKGDLKYGARRSNPDGSISLLARSIRFVHPVSKKEIYVEAPVPDDKLWAALTAAIDTEK
ncbi:MAG: RluA family pseudouridine synthase [Muribaculaceae bacterium]|nr:RluA family pseudouridine synthase [Muribaculaceae bacterium]MBQ2399683.1 RluA family pseudouridine synthase [Muribaculaceae bacterium]